MKTLLLLSLLGIVACQQQNPYGGFDAQPKRSECELQRVTTPSPGMLIMCQEGASQAFIPDSNGTLVEIVQFCPAGSYPEQGFRINHKIYAVYSSGASASLAELSPGSYTTTAPNNNCTFVVNNDGTITN